jgi:hypothetical protein
MQCGVATIFPFRRMTSVGRILVATLRSLSLCFAIRAKRDLRTINDQENPVRLLASALVMTAGAASADWGHHHHHHFVPPHHHHHHW